MPSTIADIESMNADKQPISNRTPQNRSRMVSIVSVGLAFSGIALLVATTTMGQQRIANGSSSGTTTIVDNEPLMDRRVTRSGTVRRELGSSPTNSRSTGMHKPTWRPSSKPAEHNIRSELGGQQTPAAKSALTSATAKWKDKTGSSANGATQSYSEAPKNLAPTPDSLHNAGVVVERTGNEGAVEETAAQVVYASTTAGGKQTGNRGLNSMVDENTQFHITGDAVSTKAEKESKKESKEESKKESKKVLKKESKKESKEELKKELKKESKKELKKESKKELKKESKKESEKESTKEDKSEVLPSKNSLKKELKGIESEVKSVKAQVEEQKELLPKVTDEKEKKGIKAEIKAEEKSLEADNEAIAVVETEAAKLVFSQGADFTKKGEERIARNAHTDPSAVGLDHRQLTGSPTKSPSTGLHKPTWKPSSKPAEHRQLSSTSKPNEKGKTSKPAEKKSLIGAALPR